MKTCTKCGETKALEAFNLDKRHSAGRTSACRACVSAQRRAHYKANRERMSKATAKRMRLWRERHPEEARRRSTEASQRLRETDPDYFNRWYQQHIEIARPRGKARARRFRRKHPERARKHKQRYRATHLELVRERERENTYRRRAQLATSSPETARHMTQLLQEPCAYCGATEHITIDHIIPLARGGKHEPANLAPACVTCNCSKGMKPIEQWLAESGAV